MSLHDDVAYVAGCRCLQCEQREVAREQARPLHRRLGRIIEEIAAARDHWQHRALHAEALLENQR